MEAMPAGAPEFTPRRSTYLLIFIIANHAGAALAVSCSGLSAWHAMFAASCLLLSCARSMHRWRADHWCGTGTIRIGMDGTWRQSPGNGSTGRWRPRLPVFVHPWLIVARLHPLDAGARDRSIVLLPDSLPPGEARRLRVWLRLNHAPD